MPAKKSPPARASKSKLSLTRVFDAPRSLVFAAWTDSAHMKQWSAPRGFKIPVAEGDLKPGGAWRSVMIAPDGFKLPLSGVYKKVVPDELLQFTHQWDGPDAGPETLVTVRFSDAPGGKTRMEFEQTGFTAVESRDGHAGGWNEAFDRLVELLGKLQTKSARKSK